MRSLPVGYRARRLTVRSPGSDCTGLLTGARSEEMMRFFVAEHGDVSMTAEDVVFKFHHRDR